MLKGLVAVKICYIVINFLRIKFSVVGWKRQDLMTRMFHGTALVDVDMSGISAKNSLVTHQKTIDNSRVGLGATHKEMHKSVGSVAGLADKVARLFTIMVLSVADGVLKVCRHQLPHHLRMSAFHIVRIKKCHNECWE